LRNTELTSDKRRPKFCPVLAKDVLAKYLTSRIIYRAVASQLRASGRGKIGAPTPRRGKKIWHF
jgi:hypothetical protein